MKSDQATNMRFDGTLKSWNDDRGFGFITPEKGGQVIFAHISAFPRDGMRPAIDERLSFEIAVCAEGRKQAHSIRRSGHTTAARPRRTSRPQDRNRRYIGNVIAFATMIAIGAYGLTAYLRPAAVSYGAPASLLGAEMGQPAARAMPIDFQCDSRMRCTQMTSCSEARFFLKNCPGVEMDGDHDGIPCEDQWCKGVFPK